MASIPFYQSMGRTAQQTGQNLMNMFVQLQDLKQRPQMLAMQIKNEKAIRDQQWVEQKLRDKAWQSHVMERQREERKWRTGERKEAQAFTSAEHEKEYKRRVAEARRDFMGRMALEGMRMKESQRIWDMKKAEIDANIRKQMAMEQDLLNRLQAEGNVTVEDTRTPTPYAGALGLFKPGAYTYQKTPEEYIKFLRGYASDWGIPMSEAQTMFGDMQSYAGAPSFKNVIEGKDLYKKGKPGLLQAFQQNINRMFGVTPPAVESIGQIPISATQPGIPGVSGGVGYGYDSPLYKFSYPQYKKEIESLAELLYGGQD